MFSVINYLIYNVLCRTIFFNRGKKLLLKFNEIEFLTNITDF